MESNEGLIPMDYQDLQGVFNKEASNQLPKHGALDMKIEFKGKNHGIRACDLCLQWNWTNSNDT